MKSFAKSWLSKVVILGMVVGLLLMGAPVYAATTGTSAVSGTVGEVYVVTIDDPDVAITLTPGSATNTAGVPVTATVNSNVAWTLKAHEASGDGKMSTGTDNLSNALKIKGGDVSDYTALGGDAAPVSLETNGATGGSQAITPITFQQQVDWTDIPGDYTITVTFTVAKKV